MTYNFMHLSEIFFKSTVGKLLQCIAVASLLSGCGSTIGGIVQSSTIAGLGKSNFEINNGTHYKVGNPYTILGTRYYPKENYSYVEEGIASWYGPNFHAKPTANGGVFNQNLITAAHRTLPIPSVVRVTNLENGLSIIVKITDRGPYAKDRIIDLSRETAKKLGVIKKGTALVRVQILEKQSRALKQAVLRGHSEPKLNQRLGRVNLNKIHKKTKGVVSGAYVQAGAYGDYNNALKVANSVKDLGTTKLYKMTSNGKVLYAVRIGPLKGALATKPILSTVLERGFNAIIKVM